MKKINKLISISMLSVLMIPTIAMAKEETVYSNLDSYGKYNNATVVNKLLYNGQNEINDETELKKILNISGKEKYFLDGGNITWKTDKKDIYYQGITEKELPIEVNIKYYLDGKETSVKKMKNKKGDIKIVIDLKNNEKHPYQSKDIYTPFVVSMGAIFDATNNTNISVSNGKVVDTGTNSMVVGLAAPGLYESMNLEELKDLDQITITYHTQKFKQENIYIVATPKLLDSEDLNIFNKVDKYVSKIADLQNGTNKLEEGSNTLAQGTSTLQSELGKKIAELQNSNNSYVGQTAQESVVNNLNNSLSALVENSVYNVVKTKVLATKEGVINTGIQSNCASLEQTPYYDACKEQVSAGVTNDTVMQYYQAPTYSEITTGVNQVLAYYTSQTGNQVSEENKSLATLIAYQVSGILSTTDYASCVLNENGAVTSMFSQTFASVISSYGSIASNVAIQTADQAKEQTLASLQTMYQAVSQINDGALQIAGGITELNKTGINTLTNVANKYNDYSQTIKQLKKLSKDYSGFASHNSDDTKFIFKIKTAK